jgi:hypothetical protein
LVLCGVEHAGEYQRGESAVTAQSAWTRSAGGALIKASCGSLAELSFRQGFAVAGPFPLPSCVELAGAWPGQQLAGQPNEAV